MQNSATPFMDARKRWRLPILGAFTVLLFLWSVAHWTIPFKLVGMTLFIIGACCVWRYGAGRPHAVAQGYVQEGGTNTLLALERQVTERFSSALDLLRDARLEVRLGGIYALEQHIRDSAKDQGPSVEILAAYVRDHAAWAADEPAPERLASDIQAVLTVLGRRPWSYQKEDKPLDLHGTALTKAYLPFAHLERAFLYRTNLEGAMLHKAHLQGAWLWGAYLKNANLDEAHLEGADLADAVGLTWEQLGTAYWDSETKLPSYLSKDLQSWQETFLPHEP